MNTEFITTLIDIVNDRVYEDSRNVGAFSPKDVVMIFVVYFNLHEKMKTRFLQLSLPGMLLVSKNLIQ